MEYKISEVVTRTDVPKSTILYYIKEGLLPQAKKVKPNVHKYNAEHIELLKYIKYMQETMGSSIDEIKSALEKKNDSFSGSYTMLAPLMNTLSGESSKMKQYKRSDFIEYFDIDEKLLAMLLQDKILIPLDEDAYTQKDASVIVLVENFIEVGVDYSILKEYVKHGRILADLEQKMQMDLCQVKNDKNFSILWKIMFETLFKTKEYILNRSTYKSLHKSLKDELSK